MRATTFKTLEVISGRGRAGVVPGVGSALRQPEPPLRHLRLLRQLLHLLQEARHPLLLPHDSEVSDNSVKLITVCKITG